MLEMMICGVGMFLVTLFIHFLLYKLNKPVDFWKGTTVIFIICVLGIISGDVDYFAIILGYIIGTDLSKLIGWS